MAAGSLTLRTLRAPAKISAPRLNLLLAAASIPALAILALLAVVGWVSLQPDVTRPGLTLQHYVSLYTDGFAYSTFLNTIQFALVTLLIALLFGVPIAWLLERSDIRGKPLVLSSMTLGVLIPSFCPAMGWLFLLHPRIGLVNQLAMATTGSRTAPFSLLSVAGMGWVQGLSLAPLVFVMVSASLRAMDVALEESAQMSGARFLSTMRRVTLPLLFPGLLAAGLYVLTIGISAFDIPAFIGMSNRIFTFSTYLYIQTHPEEGLPQYGISAAFSSFMVMVALLLSWWYSSVLRQARKYQVVTGKNYRPRLVQLGPLKPLAWLFLGAYLLLAEVGPLLMLVWVALLPFLQPPSMRALQALSLRNFSGLPWSLVSRGLTHTLVLAAAAPALALALSLALSWIVLRSRYRFRLVFDFIAFLPHAVPSAIFGVAALLVALFVLRGLPLYGSLTLLLLIYAIVYISFGTRITNSALIQLHPELEEAGYVAGAPVGTVLRRVMLPLLRPAFSYGWIWLALLSFRELTLATLLSSPHNVTFPVVVWSLWNGGQLSQASAVTIVLLLVLSPLMLLYWRFGGAVRPA